MGRKARWANFVEWKKYGREREYYSRTHKSLSESKKLEERSWIFLGGHKGWNRKFPLKKERGYPWQTANKWAKYGSENHYDEKLAGHLRISHNLDERRWYICGQSRGWLKNFEFSKSPLNTPKWSSFNEWREEGRRNFYFEQTPSSLLKSGNPSKAWYLKGWKMGWKNKIKFNTTHGRFSTLDEWHDYGIKRKYNQKSTTEMMKSEDENDRKWYYRGNNQRWIADFPFVRKDKIYSVNQLRKFLEEDQEAKKIARLAELSEDASDVAKVMMALWPERFPSASALVRSLPGAVKGVGHSLTPFTLEKAMRFYDKDYSVSREVKYDLDGLLYGILIEEYQVPFNEDPKETLAEIRKYTRKRNSISDLAKKVLAYYDEAYRFDIPGHGRMRSVA